MTDEILIRKVLDALPDYLQTNERVKEAIVSVISDVMVTKDYIKTLIEQSDRRFDELQKRSDEKFEALLKHSNAQFDKMQTQIDNRFNEVDNRFNEVDNRFNEVNDRFDSVEEKIEKNRSEIEKNRVGLAELSKKGEDNFKKLQVQFNDLYSRGGTELEKTILELMKETLKLNNIDPEKIRNEKLYDPKGLVFNNTSFSTDIDVLLENGNTYLVEVKTRLNTKNIDHFILVGKLYEIERKTKVTQLIMICLRTEQWIVKYGEDQGIKIIYGSIIDKL